MKEKKSGQNKKENHGVPLRFVFIMYVVAINVLSAAAATVLVIIFDRLFGIPISKIPNFVWVAIFSVVLGLVISMLVGRIILRPITRLGNAMEKVAKGDFSVRIESDSGAEEISSAYDSFNIMAKELGSIEILQADFVSNVSHEFKTPINAIEGYAMLLQSSDNVSEEQAEYIDKILFNTGRLTELIGGILLLSKIENSAIEPKKEIFRLDEQIRSAIVSLEMKWQKKELDFDVALEETKICGNENLMLHVWINLIDNAIKFSPVGGTVQITLAEENGAAKFTITDCGPGIAEESLGHIFDKFYQADSSHGKEGNGLGLALVKRILNTNGGSVFAENVDGGGCRFTVSIPVA